MTVERGDGSKSPVHVHVDEETPVHVHVSKPKKPATPTAKSVQERMSESKTRSAASFGASNLRRCTASARSRSKSPQRSHSPGGTPWIPPPGKSTKGTKLSWQGPSHRLEINPGQHDGSPLPLHRNELDCSTDDEEKIHSQMRQYERKIDNLMGEVGSLKNEVELQRSMREIERKEELLETSRQVMAEQEHELEEYKRELDLTEAENRALRRSMEEADLSRSERDRMSEAHERLMKKLVEVEMDGQAAAKQVSALRDTLRRMKEDKRLSSTDSNMLSKQRELLLERLEDFETSNRALRHMLRDRHQAEAEGVRLREQRDLLLRKLSETEESYQRLKNEFIERNREVADLHSQMDAQREENVAISGLQSSLESTRAHLQKQLRQKEGDCNRMAVQIRSLESQLAQERIEVDHLQGLVAAAKEKADRDKEALKKATRVQKQRAARSEDAVDKLNSQLLERETLMAEMRGDMDSLQARLDKMFKEKSQAIAENSALKRRVSELETLMEQVEDSSKAQVEATTAQLHDKTSQLSATRLENERLKTSLVTCEDRIVQSDNEISTLRSNIKQYEALVDEYKSQTSSMVDKTEQLSSTMMNRSRREADEVHVQLEEAQKETRRVHAEGEVELDKVKGRLQSRLQELEPLPELLKTTELKLQDSHEQLLAYEKRNTDSTKTIAELTAKVEHQGEQVDTLREKCHSTQDENRSLQTKLDSMDRKIQDLDEQNRQLLANLAKREEALHHINMRLDEQTRENASLSRQLEAALTDSRRQAEQVRDKASSKERSAQARILDLESQLSQCRAEIARVKREKEEAERRFNSRLYDLKDRLEQSHSTNRSMQNYVHFLKNSYANVFGDTSMSATSPIRSTFH